MKVYLDDTRDQHAFDTRIRQLGYYGFDSNWVRVLWPYQAIALLKTGQVEVLSLDHDLGDRKKGKERTGMDVLDWIDQEIRTSLFTLPVMIVHSANPPAKLRMEQAIRRISQCESKESR